MINLYNYDSFDIKKKNNKNRLIIVSMIAFVILVLAIALFFLINRTNYIYMSIIIGLLLILDLSSFFYYFVVIYLSRHYDYKFIDHLSSYDAKVNHIYSFQIKQEMVNKYHHSFYVVEYETKNKLKEGYIEKDKLTLFNNKKVRIIEARDRIITGFDSDEERD